MATVYLAIQESLEREVVLKCMDSERDGGSDFINRFLNEGRIIASLQHPHIITVHDIGTVHDMVWIAMEYVQGGDLKARLERSIEPIEALELVANIAQALGYGHQHGIVHRDVKPANILFREDGTALLTDFGIAKQVSQDNELTSTGTILGSPYYMSPEQAEGLQVDGRTDIYSLGVILYEMLTGERPYVGDAAVKVIMQHIQSPIPKVPESVRRFQPLINMMMAKNRDQRIATTDALVAEIRKLTGTVDTEEGESQTAPSRVQSIQQQPWTPRQASDHTLGLYQPDHGRPGNILRLCHGLAASGRRARQGCGPDCKRNTVECPTNISPTCPQYPRQCYECPGNTRAGDVGQQ